MLDPFAGVGRIHRLARPGIATVGVEIEPEWAAAHPETIATDSLEWMRTVARAGGSGRFDVAATSPCYGNRLADHHDARDGSIRHSYTHDLGRPLTEGSSGAMPFGLDYWRFHADAYRRVLSVLRPSGLFLLNVSDFVRRGETIHAIEWHLGAAYGAGFEQAARPRWIATRRLRFGENSEARADAECILILRRST